MIKIIDRDLLLEQESNSNYKIDIEISRDNKEIIKISNRIKSVYLGSKYNVQGDIDDIVNKVSGDKKNVDFIIFGLGSGEYVKKIDEIIDSGQKVIIVEPNIDIIKNYINKNEDISEKIEIIPYVNAFKDYLLINLRKIILGKFEVIEYLNYRKIFENEIVDFYQILKKTLVNRVINRNTSIYFSKIWFETTISNLKFLNKSSSIVDEKNKYKNRPAVIVSAGPSLGKNIKILKEFEDKFIIFTGGRTLRSLMEENIKPDFLSIIDADDDSYDLIDRVIDRTDTTLIHSEILPHKVLENHKAKRIFYPYSDWLSKLTIKTNYQFTYGSVAHTCLKLALYMGCNPIIFIGQDLAYTDEKVHAEIAEFEQKKHKGKEKIEHVISELDIYVDDINGNKVRTSLSLNSFREQIEGIIQENPNKVFINSTEGGANIKGTVVRDLSENIDYYENITVKSLEFKEKKGVLSVEKVYDVLSESRDELKKLVKTLDIGLRNNKKYYNYFLTHNKKMNSVSKKLEEIDKDIIEVCDKVECIKYLFADVINQVLYNPIYKIVRNDTECLKAKKIYRKCDKLYTDVKENAIYAIEYIEKELKNIEEI